MSFGVGVGDIVTVTKLVAGLRRRFIDAPEQYRGIRDDLKLLFITLSDVEVILPQCELSDDRARHYLEAHKDSVTALEEMQGKLAKFQDMGSGGTTWRSKARDIWQRLQWDDQDIIEQRERLRSIRESFDSFLQIVNYNMNLDIKTSIDQMNKREHDREKREQRMSLLNWVSGLDHSSQQRDVITKRTSATGKWLLESPEFRTWLDKPNACLLCAGVPGTGKTILSAIMTDHLQMKQQQEANIGLAFFYFNHQSYHVHDHHVVIGSLARKLLEISAVIPDEVLKLYNHGSSTPTLDKHRKIFTIMAQRYGKTYVVLDALDEYYYPNPRRFKAFIEIFLELRQLTGLSFVATCRPISEIISLFPDTEKMDIYAHEDDVERYLDSRMPELLFGEILQNPELQKSVKTSILGVMDKMFLLARLHMDSLSGEARTKDLKKALQKLPQGTQELNSLYDQAMERIKRTDPGKRDLAMNILKWVTHAQRPLLVGELQQILAVDLEENIFPDAHTELLELCTTYLALDQFPADPNDYEREYSKWTEFPTMLPLREHNLAGQFPFYIYACGNWHFHAKLARKIPEQTFEFLSNPAKTPLRDKWNYYETDILGVHLAAKYGLDNLLVALVKRGQSPEAKTHLGITPLLYAIRAGNIKTVDMLLFQYNADPNVEADGSNALNHAVIPVKDPRNPAWKDPDSPRRIILRMLLEHPLIRPNLYNLTGFPRGNKSIPELGLLLEKLVFDRKMLHIYHSPLNYILCEIIADGLEAQTIEFVKRHYTSIDEEGDGLDEPILCQMVRYYRTELVDILITRYGADKYWRHDRGGTLCHVAASNCSDDVFDLLVTKHGLDPIARDNYGMTPLEIFLFTILYRLHRIEPILHITYRHSGLIVDEPAFGGYRGLMLLIMHQNKMHCSEVDCLSAPWPTVPVPYENDEYYRLAKVLVTEYNADICKQNTDGCAISLAFESPLCKKSSAFVRELLCHQETIISDDFLSNARKFFEGEWTKQHQKRFLGIGIKDLSQEYKVFLDMLEELATQQRASNASILDRLSKDQPEHEHAPSLSHRFHTLTQPERY